MARFVTPQTVAELMGMKQPVTESDGTPYVQLIIGSYTGCYTVMTMLQQEKLPCLELHTPKKGCSPLPRSQNY